MSIRRAAVLIGLPALVAVPVALARHRPLDVQESKTLHFLVHVSGPAKGGALADVAGATVGLFPGSNATTDRNGYAEPEAGARIVAGDQVRLRVTKAGYQPYTDVLTADLAEFTKFFQRGSSLRHDFLNWMFSSSQPVTSVVLTKAPQDYIPFTVEVQDSAGKPVPSASIALCCESGRPWDTEWSNRQGEADFSLARDIFGLGVQVRVRTRSGRARWSDIPDTFPDQPEPRRFLVTLPDQTDLPDLTGAWYPKGSTQAWTLTAGGEELSDLRGHWAGGAGHRDLRGRFHALLGADNTEAQIYSIYHYTGGINIDEGTLHVTGTIAVTVYDKNLINVHIEQSNGPVSDFEMTRR